MRRRSPSRSPCRRPSSHNTTRELEERLKILKCHFKRESRSSNSEVRRTRSRERIERSPDNFYYISRDLEARPLLGGLGGFTPSEKSPNGSGDFTPSEVLPNYGDKGELCTT
ncbi:hypothetical protein NQ317_000195 [Molorchus minor]|uniref:Uncharacterized protein n=1 Tax=Molorchus minor TaxID=1323400 RepID=A0ABQ9JEX9_9CUCU|nr:hypothetical protein NQ317_000195 [Molorchus minor]